MAEDEKSLTWLVVAAAIFVAVFGWGFLAGSYAGAHAPSLSGISAEDGREINTRGPSRAKRGALLEFVTVAIEQLPNLPAVISWHFANRIWLPILIGLAMVGVFVGGFALKRVDATLNKPPHKRR